MKTNNKEKKKNNSQSRQVFRRVMSRMSVKISIGIIVLLALACIFAPLLTPYSYDQISIPERFQGPSLTHLLGTDDMGRDLLTRLLYGGRYSMRIGIESVALAAIVGVSIGSIAGYFGGLVDNILMRLIDILQSIPGLLFCIIIATTLGSGYRNTVLALSITSIWEYVRMMRAQVLSIRKMEYLEAASEINCGTGRIIIRHLVPNCLSPIIVQATMGIGQAILVAAGLSFIGLGIQPPEAEWGALLSSGRAYVRDYSYMVIFPGMFIGFTVLAFNLIGDALRDALDPKLKN